MNTRLLLWIIFLLCIALDISLAFASWDDIRGTIGWVKHVPQKTSFKLRHIVQYSPQAYLLMMCLKKSCNFNLKTRSILTIILISCIGGVTEVIQLYRPQRIFSLMDMFWNFIAACLGVIAYLCWESLRRDKLNND